MEDKFETIETSSPYSELQTIAYNNDDEVKNYDFKLISFYTEYSNKGKKQNLDGFEGLEIFEDDGLFLDSSVKLEQKYKINIIKAKPRRHGLDISLSANKSLTKIIATVKKNENAKFYSKLEEDVVNDITKKLIKAKILIGLRSNYMFDGVKSLVNRIRVHGLLDTDFQFIVAIGIEPKEPIAGELRLIYKEKKIEKDENKKIDYANRGFICAVRKRELIMEYTKPQKGSDGKNLRGEFIKVNQATTNDNEPKIHAEEILAEEKEDKIIYKAAKSGYISQDKDGYFGIKDNIELLKADFKSTGSINAGLDKNVKLKINNKDAVEDVIGPNITIEIEELKIDGSIAQNAIIKAKKAEIGGQTHSKSEVYAKECNIMVHKGYCEGENIVIERLEGGEVHGVNVKIKQALGGKVYAENLVVDTITTNSMFYITKSAMVSKCHGENNKFVVSPSNSKETKEAIRVKVEEIEKINKELSFISNPIKAKKALINMNKDSIIKIKTKIEELQKQNVEPPKAFFSKLKDFQNTVNSYNELVKQEKILTKKLEDDTKALKEIQDRIFDAKVVNKGRWRNLNEIKFILDYPKQELVYSTKEGEFARTIKLVEDTSSKEEFKLMLVIENAAIKEERVLTPNDDEKDEERNVIKLVTDVDTARHIRQEDS